SITFTADDKANPADFGITSPSAVFPNINVPGSIRFGGIDGFPQGRGDTTFQYADTLGWVRGKHSVKFGAEFRRFRNNGFAGGTGGIIDCANLAPFLTGKAGPATQTPPPASPAMP